MKILLLIPTLFFCVFSLDVIHEPNRCVMYGQDLVKRPLFNNTLAVEENDSTLIDQIREICGPSAGSVLSKPGPNGNPRICCSAKQIETMKGSLGLAVQMLSSCSACYRNFVGFWCHFTCSPDQSTFLNPIKVDSEKPTNSNKTPKEFVDTVEFYVTKNFSDHVYDSCKDVKFSADNSRALDLVAPGSVDGMSFFRKIGTKVAGFNPIQINFPEESDPLPTSPASNSSVFGRFQSETFSCDNDLYKCSCTDCFKACPSSYPPSKIQPTCHIGNTNWECIAFGATIFYIVFVLAVIGISLVWRVAAAIRMNSVALYNPLPAEIADFESKRSFLSDDEDAPLIDKELISTSNWKIDRYLRRIFRKIGFFCATYPKTVVWITLFFVAVLSIGWLNFKVETNPINLWVDPSSKALKEKQFFDEKFSPFYRITQLIVTKENETETVFDWAFLNQTWHIQKLIENIQIVHAEELHDLKTLCLKPTLGACATQSFKGWYQDDYKKFLADTKLTKFKTCVKKPGDRDCLAASLQPLSPKLTLGGVTSSNSTNWEDAKALIITFVLNSSLDQEKIDGAVLWERKFVSVLQNMNKKYPELMKGIKIAYSTESSIEDELSRETTADVPTIILSYILMFFYASIALGKFRFSYLYRNPMAIFVNSRFSLGIGGILIVIASVVSSIGLLSFFGQKATLIIAEVIPFLVLAVGVDNIFILVNTFDRITRQELSRRMEDSDYEDEFEDIPQSPVANRIAETVASVGPSIFLSSSCETLAFGLGVAVSMPAVSIFSMYAATAVLLNFLLQITCFVAFLTLDSQRREGKYIDCIPSVPVHFEKEDSFNDAPFLEKVFSKYYAPFLLHRNVKPLILIAFTSLFVFGGLYNFQNVQLGLEQRLALPRSSYMVKYFDAIEKYLEVGPPLYLIFKGKSPNAPVEEQGLDLSKLGDMKKICGKFNECHEWSVTTLLEMEYRKAGAGKHTTIATPTSVWFDDFVTYLNNVGLPCCAKNGERLKCLVDPPSPDEDLDDIDEDNNYDNHIPSCACIAWRDLASTSHPGYGPLFDNRLSAPLPPVPQNNTQLVELLKIWLKQVPGTKCPTAGLAAYSSSISFAKDQNGEEFVDAFVLRTYHNTLRTQNDFIGAVRDARQVSKNIMEKSLGYEFEETNDIDPVYPYSIFYVFFEQYETIWSLASTLIAFAFIAIFIIVVFFIGSPIAAVGIIVVVGMMVVDLIGVMALWDVSLNAVSTVNLVIAVGIGVEFCVHVARGAVLEGSVSQSLTELGSSVFSGITLTKLIGISVLAFAQSKIFEVFYFRMYLAIVLLGATHGLILFPVILDYIIPSRLRR